MIQRMLVLLSVMLLASCTVKSNLGDFLKSKADTEIRSGVVEVYDQSEIFRHQYRFLGQVETFYCQNEKFGTLPPERKLKKILKVKAQKKGGNGIVYGLCETKRSYQNCDLHLNCEADVYSIQF